MPGFLDDLGYGGVTRIDLGKDYWVDVKNCLTEEEIAEVWNISLRTVKREWSSARLWLFAELTRGPTPHRLE